MKKRTKIVATVGPASDSVGRLEELVRAGVNVFRLNFSHGDYEYHTTVLGRIREVMKKTGLVVGVLQDISGPKIRIGELEHSFELRCGDVLEFVEKKIVGHRVDNTHYRLTLNQKEILKKLHIGQFIYLYDGIIRAKVTEIKDGSVFTIIENDGVLSAKKGVNFPNTYIGIDVLTKKDKSDIAWGVKNDVDFMAISFVQNAHDMLSAREIVDKHGGTQMLIAKIEKFDAIQNIDAIIDASDGIMVARGDLGIEVPFYEVPNIQKLLIRKANEASKPVITATQMLLSMTKNQRATRAEISDIANAVLDGTDAVMLSEESAVGDYPVLAVKTMFETIRETEKEYPYNRFYENSHKDTTNAIDESAVRLSRDLNVEGILALTNSGSSARKLARYHPDRPIYAITHDDKVRRRLTLSWGVVPAFSVKRSSLGQALKDTMNKGLSKGVLDKTKRYILTAGDPMGVSGSTNLIRILSGDEMEFFKNLNTK
ncbi:pyruvate kinase [Sulfurimonas sp.]|uniref:pyruvate kinase n=1 Tax=Sulfurimonas sp. TaxID=2022749 RepID=UPI0025F4E0B4|nr:pyruvate kinase [Sulfurimonas sp.]MCK9453736.1 pyruvate kinase [Sulfurimonas sp.]